MSSESKRRSPPTFRVPRGEKVFIHQAFRCCPYAGLITSKIHDFVELNGYQVVDEPADAAVQVINTCGYNETRSQLAYDAIETVRRENPCSPIVVAGCLTKIEPREVRAALAGVERQAILGPAQLEELDVIFESRGSSFEEVPTAFHKDRYTTVDPRVGLYQITVNTGCLGRCRFCAIRRAQGRPVSMPLTEVLARVERGLSEGHRDFFLAGSDISAYGTDIGLTVVDLLRALADVDEQVTFSGEAFAPTNFFDRLDQLLPLFAGGKFAWLVFPVQSGSQRILDLMRRDYSIAEVMTGLRRIKDADPTIVTCTDIIYGYEDETWEEFLESVEVGRQFDYAKYNNYEPRPGTPPLALSPAEMVRRREFVMEELKRQGLEIDVLTRKRIRPYEGARGHDSGPSAEVKSWLTDQARRFERLVERKGGIDLGGGWRIVEARADIEDAGAVLLTARGPRNRVMTLALAHPNQPGRYLGRSDRYQLYLRAEAADAAVSLDPAGELALSHFIQSLGLHPLPESTAERAVEPPRDGVNAVGRQRLALHANGHDKWSDPLLRQPAVERAALEALAGGDVEAALAALAAAREPDGRARRGEILLWLGRSAEASEALMLLHGAEPHLERPRLGLAVAALIDGRFEESLALLDTMPASPLAAGLAGEALRHLGDWHRAGETLVRATTAQPTWLAPWVNLALLEAERGRRGRMRLAAGRVRELGACLLDDALAELSQGSLDDGSPSDLARVVGRVYAMLRGNRDPEIVTWIPRDGRLRASLRQPQR